MAAVTDLTFTQLNDALKQMLGTGTINNFLYADSDGLVNLNISGLLSSQSVALTSTGVIKAITVLFDAARIAQETANTGKAAGEKLTAFPAPTFGTLANGYAPVTRSLTARALLSSATQIVGTNA